MAESTARIASQTPRARIQRKTRGRLARVALETLETRRMLTAVTNDKFYSDFWPMQIGVWFDTNVSSSLTASDLELTNLWQGAQMLANTDYVISDYDSENNQATFSVTYEPPTSGPEPAGILPDGDYEAIFSADGITDVNGEPMAADASAKYSSLPVMAIWTAQLTRTIMRSSIATTAIHSRPVTAKVILTLAGP